MAAKPTPPSAVWASDTNFSSGPQSGTPTKVTPSSGVLTQGAVAEEAAPAGFYNYLFNYLDRSARYVLDGVFSGAASFDDDLSVGGDLDVTGTATAQNVIAKTGIGAYTFVFTDTGGSVAAKTRNKRLNLSTPSPNYFGAQKWFPGSISTGVASNTDGIYFPGGATPGGGVDATRIPVELPQNASVHQIEIGAYADTTGGISVLLVHSTHAAGGGPATTTTIGSVSTSGAGVQHPVVLFTAHTIDNTAGTYYLYITATGAPSIGHSLHWVNLTFDELVPSGNGT